MKSKLELSVREKEIVYKVSQAKCRKMIACELNISIHTVDSHLRSLHLKTGTHSLPELVVWALKTIPGLNEANLE
jgi:DNA-binding CsgD family transcriptional regulator